MSFPMTYKRGSKSETESSFEEDIEQASQRVSKKRRYSVTDDEAELVPEKIIGARLMFALALRRALLDYQKEVRRDNPADDAEDEDDDAVPLSVANKLRRLQLHDDDSELLVSEVNGAGH